MQDNPMQTAMQPLMKLAQSNMELFMKFSVSPDAMTQSLANAQSLFSQGKAPSTTNLYTSSAFRELMQGLVKNYTDFLMESAQSGMTILAQGQAAIVRQAEEMGANGMEATESKGRRGSKG